MQPGVLLESLLSHCVQKGIDPFQLGNQIYQFVSFLTLCPARLICSLHCLLYPPWGRVLSLSQIQYKAPPSPLHPTLCPPSLGSGLIHSLMQDLLLVRSLGAARDVETDRVTRKIKHPQKTQYTELQIKCGMGRISCGWIIQSRLHGRGDFWESLDWCAEFDF